MMSFRNLVCNRPVKSWRSGKKRAVKACSRGKDRIIHFGAKGYGHNYSSTARRSFRARHKCNMAKDKLSARYWACKNLWTRGGSKQSCPSNRKCKSRRLSRRRKSIRKSRRLSRRRKSIRKSKRLSRRRKSIRKSKRLSRRRKSIRKSKRLSRRRKSIRQSIFKFNGELCSPSVNVLPKLQIKQLAKKIILLQDDRKKYLSNQLKKSVRFSYGMRSKTRYGDKALRSAYNYSNRWVTYLTRTQDIKLKIIELTDTLSQTVYNNATIDNLMFYVDIGYRFGGLPRTNKVIVLFNLIMYGYLLTQDWQMFLLTPLSINILKDVILGDPLQQIELVKMFMHISCNGVAPTDILNFVPQISNLCNPDTTAMWIINRGGRHILYQLLVIGSCSDYVGDAWNNIFNRVIY